MLLGRWPPREAWPSSKHLCWSRRTCRGHLCAQRPSRVDLSSPFPIPPPPTTSRRLWSLSPQGAFYIGYKWNLLLFKKVLCQSPPPRALSQVVVGEGHRWAVPHTGGGGQAHLLVQDGSGEQSRLRWAILVSAGSSAGFVGRLKFKVQQGALRVEGGKSSPWVWGGVGGAGHRSLSVHWPEVRLLCVGVP